MFENIVIRGSDIKGGPLDPGLIAETLLFYQSVHLLLDHGSLSHLLREIGPDCLLRLIDEPGTKVTYLRNRIGTHTDRSTGLQIHNFVAYSLVGDQKTGHLKKDREQVEFLFDRTLGKSRDTKRFARRFMKQARFSSLARGFGHDRGLLGVARDDLDNEEFLKEAVQIVVRKYVPDYEFPKDWRFKIVDCENGFLVDSSLDYDELTRVYQRLNPGVDRGDRLWMSG